ncbi:endonuclease domain-containing protein [Hymenobacter sp. DH14]|uniref:Endonuclease domain-containing protein n=1 Tax=Hymenobacter cyanobacteriorum TaxID=2926463 RepID=A0A9X2AGB9_9BACT|nr:endonuclease domain-containing protein [Hymenobacter cyanobacteriorum]MCI1189096.1 endonuclease domain-containing protein [Hymenobacter cyanobacteriorum]
MEHHREDYILSADKRQYGKLDLKGRARAMRHQPTAAEDDLWQALRGGQVGAKFRRQHPIDRYIVDFVCIDAKLVVEIDGGSHLDADQRDYDAGRTALLAEMGFRVLRFANARVLGELEAVLVGIQAALHSGR